MGKLHLHIVANFTTCDALVKQRKFTEKPNLVVNTTNNKGQRKDTYIVTEKVKHSQLKDEIELVIEGKKTCATSFKFQLRCTSFYEKPFFRFDSDGAAHKNFNPNTLLRDMMVTTPHFNYFGKDGREYAYKSAQLQDPNELKALEDITLSFHHFCNECNIRYPEDTLVELTTVNAGLSIPSEEDLLANVNFRL